MAWAAAVRTLLSCATLCILIMAVLRPGAVLPAPASQLVLQQVFLEDRPAGAARVAAARDISAAAAAGAAAGVRAAMGTALRPTPVEAVSSQSDHPNRKQSSTNEGSGAQSAADNQQKPEGCNPKVPTGVVEAPQPNPCPWWQAMHEKFAQDIQASDAGEGYEVIFYGDSLTEMWRGTRSDQPYPPRSHMPEVFQSHFGRKWRAVAMGMSGDTVANVRWRLDNGELPARRHPRLAVLLAGTNDLRDAKVYFDHKSPVKGDTEGASAAVAQAAPGIARRLQGVVELLRRRLPETQVLLMGLLPRHKMDHHGPINWPNYYTEGLAAVNGMLKAYAETEDAVTYLECGHLFFATPELLNAELMPDALHPNSAGVELLAACIGAALEEMLGGVESQ